MAGMLPTSPDAFKPIPWAKIAIISSLWHQDIIHKMISVAQQALIRLGIPENQIMLHYLPGSLELPYAADMLFTKYTDLDAILAFGVVLKGITNHDSSVLDSVIQGFNWVGQRHHKPIINEVIGVSTLEDARKRAGDDHQNKGLEAVFAVSELLYWKKFLL